MATGKRVLLTGATGFVGGALGKALVREGWAVVALVRDVERAKAALAFPAELVPWSEGALTDIDAVVHLAGESVSMRWTKSNKEKILRSRVDTTKRLRERVASCGGRKPSVYVAASAIGIYGDRGEELLTERSGAGEGFLAETCRAWEVAHGEWGKTVGRMVVLRVGLVLGRGGGVLERILPLFRAHLGGRLGSGRQWLSWIQLEDLVNMVLFALREEGLRGTFNAVAPEPVTNSVFTAALAGVLGRFAPFPAPAFALRLALGEMAGLLLDSQRVSSRKISEAGFRFRYPRLKEALAESCGENP